VPESHSVHPAAERELLRVARWYRREAGSSKAHELLGAFEAAVDRACEAPGACSILFEERGLTFRSLRVRGFPYRIVFFVRRDALRVIAMAHVRRRPGYWKWRLRGEPRP
jgi:plasmid stabilization system protein ParE